MGNKNSYTYKQYSRNRNILTLNKLIIVIASFLILSYLLSELLSSNYGFIGALLIFIMTLITIRVFKYLRRQNRGDFKKNYYTWGRGAGAELSVERDLEKLGPDYRIIADFPIDKGNIDFIIICTKGIFTIEVKAIKGIVSHENMLLINGRPPIKDFIHQTLYEVSYLNNLLNQQYGKNYDITGILEFPYAKIDTSTINGKIKGIWIGGRRFHNYAIKKSNDNLAFDEIESIANYLYTLKNNRKKVKKMKNSRCWKFLFKS